MLLPSVCLVYQTNTTMSKLSPEDIEMLRDSARRFFSEQMPVSAMRKLRDEKHATGFDTEMWQGMAGMGWPAILISEGNGGLDLGYESLGIVLEESGRTLAASPLVATAVLGAMLIEALGSEQQRSQYLGAIAEGELTVALAIDEKRRHQPTNIQTIATLKDSVYRLNGKKTFVLDGHVADRILVVARTAGGNTDCNGLSLFNIDPGAAGVEICRTHMVDGRNAANITFDNVACHAENIFGEAGKAFPAIEKCLDAARVALAAEMLGAMSEAFDRTMEYLRIRNQFDVPIGSFQALKHRAAEMFCDIQLTRSAVYQACVAMDEDDESDTARLASLAKAKASKTFERVSNEAVQMHGGIGMTDAEEIGLFLKRARVAQQTFGDFDFHRDRYATLAGF